MPLTVINSAGSETTWDSLTARKSKYIYTVDDITLTHSGGGTSAENPLERDMLMDVVTTWDSHDTRHMQIGTGYKTISIPLQDQIYIPQRYRG